ncbi:MAG: hypothetical protein KBB91_01245 [Candidatus Pacebacteria bacterium]|nr:hypothetical protein [Candidatus Paceibacterota bacterium]MBP9701001.1 hypothetical protein [Candidatus Paceibacterota bacterium]
MKSRVQDKIKAISLRMQGYTYQQIMAEVPVSKGLLSGWLQKVRLSGEQEKILIENMGKCSKAGVAKAAASNMTRRKKRETDAIDQAQVVFEQYHQDPIFIAGLSLYWAEGTKRSSQFGFMNSDPAMVKFMIYWAQKYLGISQADISLRLHTHADFILEKYEDFWSSATGVPLSQFRKTIYKPNERHGVFKKNPLYKGCVRLEVGGGMALLRTMIGLQHALNSSLEMLYSPL